MPWATELYERTRKSVETILAQRTGEGRPAERARFLAELLEALATKISDVHRMRQFVVALTALRHHAAHSGLAPHEVNKLAELARGLLAVGGVQQAGSNLSYLRAKERRALGGRLGPARGDRRRPPLASPRSAPDRRRGAPAAPARPR